MEALAKRQNDTGAGRDERSGRLSLSVPGAAVRVGPGHLRRSRHTTRDDPEEAVFCPLLRARRTAVFVDHPWRNLLSRLSSNRQFLLFFHSYFLK